MKARIPPGHPGTTLYHFLFAWLRAAYVQYGGIAERRLNNNEQVHLNFSAMLKVVIGIWLSCFRENYIIVLSLHIRRRINYLYHSAK